jgi:hypothetical protein
MARAGTHPQTFLNTYFKGCELANNFTVQYMENSLLAAVNELSNCAYPKVEVVNNTGKANIIRLEMGVKVGVFLNKSTVKGWFNGPTFKNDYKPRSGCYSRF